MPDESNGVQFWKNPIIISVSAAAFLFSVVVGMDYNRMQAYKEVVCTQLEKVDASLIVIRNDIKDLIEAIHYDRGKSNEKARKEEGN